VRDVLISRIMGAALLMHRKLHYRGGDVAVVSEMIECQA